MKFGIFSGLLVALILGYTIAAGIESPSQPIKTDARVNRSGFSRNDAYDETYRVIAATAYSRKCATPEGSCTLRKPQKVGSRCQCRSKDEGEDSKRVTGKVVR